MSGKMFGEESVMGSVRHRMKSLWVKVNRKKTVTDDFIETPLNRCLNTFDITLLGIGHMIGAGIYVLTGTVVKELAGPSAIISYLVAGFAAILSALCYAEFGAKVPKAGSAYSYTYVALGELWGFVIGWNIVLEHLLGTAAVARAFSGSVDAIFNGAIRNGTIERIGYLSKDSQWLSEYPDFIAFLACAIVLFIVGIGAKFTMHFNSVFTIINMIVIVFLIIGGFVFADMDNWTNSQKGGFFPNGFIGTLGGAASCFFAYIGFEGIATAGEEAKNPEKSIPISTVTALGIVTVLYVLVTISLTLMVPYDLVDPTAAFPMAFALRGAQWAKYIVAFGTLFGITTSLLGGAFSLPRSIYAMASDGLLFQIFAYVHPKTQTPVWGIFCFGLLAAIMAFLFEIDTLVEFMSIGTLMAYTIVGASVIILRYLPLDKCQFKLKPEEEMNLPSEVVDSTEGDQIIRKSKSHDDFGKLKQNLKNLPLLRDCDPGNAPLYATFAILIFIVCLCANVMLGWHHLASGAWWSVLLTIVLAAAIILSFFVMIAHEKNDAFTTFQMPLVPLIPVASIFCNVSLMMNLKPLTWARLGIWMAVGLLVYFVYGIHNSKERQFCSEYSEIINYPSHEASTAIPEMTEEIKEQQPLRNPKEGFHGQSSPE